MVKPDLNMARLAELIAGDVALSYKLLRYVNSAMFRRRSGSSLSGRR
ncbi:MAG: HDOD domain-containing protein [Acidobacteriota bacterium]